MGCFLWRHVECLIESPICRFDSQFVVQNEEWISQRPNDVLAIGQTALQRTFLLSALGHVTEHQHDTGDLPVPLRIGAALSSMGRSRTVLGDKQGVVCQSDDDTFTQGPCGRILDSYRRVSSLTIWKTVSSGTPVASSSVHPVKD